jgi:hypothetical protein
MYFLGRPLERSSLVMDAILDFPVRSDQSSRPMSKSLFGAASEMCSFAHFQTASKSPFGKSGMSVSA